MTAAGLARLWELGITEQDLRDWQTAVGVKPDGDPGPLTFAGTVKLLRSSGLMPSEPPVLSSGSRSRVVDIALGELGPWRTSQDQDPQKYIRDAAPVYIGQPPNAKAWCGIFWLWCLRQAGLTSKTWADGKGFAYGYLPTVSIPEPGDGMYFGGRLSHYAVVERVANGRVYTIEGNTLPAPREGVTYREHPINAVTPGGGCYFSIRNLIARPEGITL